MNQEQNNLHEDHHKNYQRKGKGRRKIKIEKIENKNNLEVTYSKRRKGVFKKASELSTLTGADTGVIVFTPKGKAHSFGSPDLETVANRLLNNADPNGVNLNVEAQRKVIQENTEKLAKIEGLVEYEKNVYIDLNKHKTMRQNQGLVPGELNQLNLQQLFLVERTINNFSDRFNVAYQCYMNAENKQVWQGTNTSVPSRLLQPNLLNVVHPHASTSTSARPLTFQGFSSSTTRPISNPSFTFGGRLTIGGQSGMNVGGSSGTVGGPSGHGGTNFDKTLSQPMFSDNLSTQFHGESFGVGNSTYTVPFGRTEVSYGTDVVGPSNVSMANESWYQSSYPGVAGNMLPPTNDTFGGYGGQYSYPDASDMVSFSNGTNFRYPSDFRAGPSADEDFGSGPTNAGPSTGRDFGAGPSNNRTNF